MRRTLICKFVQVVVMATLTSTPTIAATFEVVDEEDGQQCWLEFALSPTETLVLLSGKGLDGKSIEILLEDKQEEGDLSKLPEKFEMSFQFSDGTRQVYEGAINEYFGLPYAEAQLNLLEKFSGGNQFDLSVTGLALKHVKDTLSKRTYKQFLSCISN